MGRDYRPRSIEKQTLVLSGISDPVGYEAAFLAAVQGARVVISSSEAGLLRDCLERIHARGGEAITVLGDATKLEDLNRIKDEALRHFHRIDTWVNCGSFSLDTLLSETELVQEKRLFDVNFWSARMGCQVAVEAMKSEGGVIINMGSDVASLTHPLMGLYCASKAALKMYTDSLRSELKGQGLPIEVCLLRPDQKHGAHINAEAIVRSAARPKRDVYVGGPARLTAIMETFFPEVKDLMTESELKSLLAKEIQPRTDQ